MTNLDKSNANTWLIAVIAIAIYYVYYFVLLNMPIIGIPTFRIDYFAATVTRADDSLWRSILHARPVSELYVYLQALAAKYLLAGKARLIIYPLQHISLFVYFFSVLFAIQTLLGKRLHPALVIASWVVFMASPAVIGGVYKLETIVGTISRLFGGLSLVAISCWARRREPTNAALFVLFYCLSIFSKEDYILPPLFVLGWHVFQDGVFRQRIREHWKILAATASVVVFFVVFNKALLPTRSYMDPAKAIDAPYFMTLAPPSLLRVAAKYVIAYGVYIQVITAAYVAATLAALISRQKIFETLLVAVIVGGLMAPYLIMPNHVFVYYSINWIVWQIVFSAAIVQMFFGRPWQSNVVSALTIIWISILAVIGVAQKNSTEWRKSHYFQQNFDIAKNVQSTLRNYRITLNTHSVVGVVGVGPGEIAQSPWQNNGETSFYISGDLGVTPKWIVFVKSGDHGYAANRPMSETLQAGGLPAVTVLPLKSLVRFTGLPLLVFSPDGTGELLEHPSQALLVNPDLLSVRDFIPGTLDPAIKQNIGAGEDYSFLRGFNNAELNNGRWLSDNNVVLLKYHSGDHFELTAYAPPLTSYARKSPPNIAIAFNECEPISQSISPGKVSTLTFAIPANCSLRPGMAVNVRIRVDNLVDTSRSTDKRSLGVLGKKLGFTEKKL